MESGKHRMSLKLIKGDGNDYLFHLFGLVRDGAALDKAFHNRESTDAWYIPHAPCTELGICLERATD